MNTLNPLTMEKVVGWAIERNILSVYVGEDSETRIIFPNGGGTTKGQAIKTVEESLELMEHCVQLHQQFFVLCDDDMEDYQMLLNKIKDDIGDVLVTLIINSAGLGIDLDECLSLAYDDIKDRKGQMVNGIFVKEVPTPEPAMAYAEQDSEAMAEEEGDMEETRPA